MTVTVKHYGTFPMIPLGQTNPHKALAKAAELLDGHRWWLSAGTALGLHRDGDFIPHDTDVDVGLAADWDNPPPDDLLPWRLIRSQHLDGRPMQLAYMRYQVIFDIYLFYGGVNVNEHGKIVKPSRFLDELGTVAGYPAPAPIDEYLAWRYGPDWAPPAQRKRPWQDEAPCLVRGEFSEVF